MNGILSRDNVRKPVHPAVQEVLTAYQQVRPIETYERDMVNDQTEREEIMGGRVLIVLAVACFLIGVGLMGWMVWR